MDLDLEANIIQIGGIKKEEVVEAIEWIWICKARGENGRTRNDKISGNEDIY